ncbi:MAG: HmuY family protein [Bacteroidales bacterium]|nr:HmuY family protein [Bacteroidales bacterium]
MQKYFQYSISFMLGVSAVTLSACSGLVDVYDELPDGTGETEYAQLNVKATTYGDWTYVSLHDTTLAPVVLDIPLELTGEWDGVTCYTRQQIKLGTSVELSSIPTDTQPEPEEWDLAFHHFDVRTNRGCSLETEYTSLDQLPDSLSGVLGIAWEPDSLTSDRVWVDLSSSLSYNIGCQTIAISHPLSRLVSMDVSNPPPIYNVSGRVCLVKFQDGSVAALFLDNYMNEKNQKGYLTISYIYPYE